MILNNFNHHENDFLILVFKRNL